MVPGMSRKGNREQPEKKGLFGKNQWMDWTICLRDMAHEEHPSHYNIKNSCYLNWVVCKSWMISSYLWRHHNIQKLGWYGTWWFLFFWLDVILLEVTIKGAERKLYLYSPS